MLVKAPKSCESFKLERNLSSWLQLFYTCFLILWGLYLIFAALCKVRILCFCHLILVGILDGVRESLPFDLGKKIWDTGWLRGFFVSVL